MNLCLLLVFAGAVNLAAFSVGAALIGGYAGLGRVEAGRFFVGVADAYLPVSRAVFLYSLWHGYSQGMTALPGLAGAFFLWRRRLSTEQGRGESWETVELPSVGETWLRHQEV